MGSPSTEAQPRPEAPSSEATETPLRGKDLGSRKGIIEIYFVGHLSEIKRPKWFQISLYISRTVNATENIIGSWECTENFLSQLSHQISPHLILAHFFIFAVDDGIDIAVLEEMFPTMDANALREVANSSISTEDAVTALLEDGNFS